MVQNFPKLVSRDRDREMDLDRELDPRPEKSRLEMREKIFDIKKNKKTKFS